VAVPNPARPMLIAVAIVERSNRGRWPSLAGHANVTTGCFLQAHQEESRDVGSC